MLLLCDSFKDKNKNVYMALVKPFIKYSCRKAWKNIKILENILIKLADFVY